MNTTIKARIVEHQQGTEGWHQHRAKSLNASELAVAMGISSNMQRNELIKCKATGIPFEHSDFVEQRVFAPGHAFEAAARPLAEEVIGEDLYCSVFAAEVDGLLLSASLDGHTLMNDITWEHKQASDELIAGLEAGIIPGQYHPQMEQGFLLTGATKCMFSASKGTKESMRSVWYESNPELRAKIIPTWKQFMADVAAYVPEAKAAPVVAAPVETLPAVSVKVEGALVIASNLPDFGTALRAFIAKIPEQPSTDQEFADTEAACKALKRAEEALEAAESNALAQLSDVDTMRRFVADFKALARTTRLQREKLVTQRKEAIKSEIVAGGVAALAKHLRELNAAMPDDYMPQVPADFGGCIKGLKSVDSIRNAVDTELSRAKIAASEIANKIHGNVAKIDAANAPMLFAYDIKALVLKAPEDLAAVIAQRLAAEKAKEEAQRERIRAEEAARLEREAAAKAAAEKAEAERLEREHAAKVEAERIARERQEAVSAQRIRDELIASASKPLTTAEVDKAESDHGIASAVEKCFASGGGAFKVEFIDMGDIVDAEVPPTEDNGIRLSLGQLNELLAPVSITVAGLSALGFDPVEQVKASRLYRECDFRAICIAISAHVLAARVATTETV